MSLSRLLVATAFFMVASIAAASDGLIAVKSTRDTATTATRLEELLKTRGQTIFARIDHAAGAAKVGKTLRPTMVVVFGNPVGGTPLMECAQTMGIDLPQKMLVWEDEKGQTWIGYNDPAYLLQRHGVSTCAATDNVRKALAGLVEATVAP
jgi:uncharacterized protein (DUF302 family)